MRRREEREKREEKLTAVFNDLHCIHESDILMGREEGEGREKKKRKEKGGL